MPCLQTLPVAYYRNDAYHKGLDRYTDVLPCNTTTFNFGFLSQTFLLDENNVFEFKETIGNDYINASPISFDDSLIPFNKFISTQGPLESTVVDFWRMIYEAKCSRIVMLTNVAESGCMVKLFLVVTHIFTLFYPW